MKKINLVIYGATGSIGKSVFSIIAKNSDKINVEGITCNTNIAKLCQIAKLHDIKKIGFNEKSIKHKNKLSLRNYRVFNDLSNFHNIITDKTDIIVFAISGLAPLNLLIKILKTGKKIGIANKECIISLGKRLNLLAKKHSTEIVPLDSEHNAIYHLLKNDYGPHKLVTITATGGPFLNYNKNKLNSVTPSQAIKHPIWKMGPKISIDSSTMMNKALEIIEAKYLFNLKDDEIDAIIHPQAIIHAMLSYENGMSFAVLNKPDMRIPISSLFFKFNKNHVEKNNLRLSDISKLEFIAIDHLKFPAIKLGFQVMKIGGIAPHVFNYLNELLVNLFIKNKIKYVDIVKLNEQNLDKFFAKNSNISNPKLIDIKNINKWIDNNIYTGN